MGRHSPRPLSPRNLMMKRVSEHICGRGVPACAIVLLTLSLAACSGSGNATFGQPLDPVGANLIKISSDPFNVAPGQHATQVEPHMLANGSTLVAAFQTGRIAPGGATDIGWATSTDGGTTWSHGFLPGLT